MGVNLTILQKTGKTCLGSGIEHHPPGHQATASWASGKLLGKAIYILLVSIVLFARAYKLLGKALPDAWNAQAKII